MEPDIHAKFHNQPFIMRRAILMILPGHTHGHTQLKCYSWLSNKLAIAVLILYIYIYI